MVWRRTLLLLHKPAGGVFQKNPQFYGVLGLPQRELSPREAKLGRLSWEVFSKGNSVLEIPHDLDSVPEGCWSFPEVWFVGRKNSGKTGVVRGLIFGGPEMKSLTQGTLAGTKALVYHNVGDAFALVDTPAFSQGHKRRRVDFGVQIATAKQLMHLRRGGAMKRVYFCVNAYEGLTPVDADMATFLLNEQIPYTVLLTKIDLLGEKQTLNPVGIKKAADTVFEAFGTRDLPLIEVSAHKQWNMDALRADIMHNITVELPDDRLSIEEIKKLSYLPPTAEEKVRAELRFPAFSQGYGKWNSLSDFKKQFEEAKSDFFRKIGQPANALEIEEAKLTALAPSITATSKYLGQLSAAPTMEEVARVQAALAGGAMDALSPPNTQPRLASCVGDSEVKSPVAATFPTRPEAAIQNSGNLVAAQQISLEAVDIDSIDLSQLSEKELQSLLLTPTTMPKRELAPNVKGFAPAEGQVKRLEYQAPPIPPPSEFSPINGVDTPRHAEMEYLVQHTAQGSLHALKRMVENEWSEVYGDDYEMGMQKAYYSPHQHKDVEGSDYELIQKPSRRQKYEKFLRDKFVKFHRGPQPIMMDAGAKVAPLLAMSRSQPTASGLGRTGARASALKKSTGSGLPNCAHLKDNTLFHKYARPHLTGRQDYKRQGPHGPSG